MEVIAKDIGDDFIERWFVACADFAGRVVVGVEVPPSLVEGGSEWPHRSDWAQKVRCDNHGGNKASCVGKPSDGA